MYIRSIFNPQQQFASGGYDVASEAAKSTITKRKGHVTYMFECKNSRSVLACTQSAMSYVILSEQDSRSASSTDRQFDGRETTFIPYPTLVTTL